MSNPQTYGTPHVFGLLDTSQAFITNQSDSQDSTCVVDVKVCAIDATWSGLKLVYRTKDR